jgi:hypothetical protein
VCMNATISGPSSASHSASVICFMMADAVARSTALSAAIKTRLPHWGHTAGHAAGHSRPPTAATALAAWSGVRAYVIAVHACQVHHGLQTYETFIRVVGASSRRNSAPSSVSPGSVQITVRYQSLSGAAGAATMLPPGCHLARGGNRVFSVSLLIGHQVATFGAVPYL